MLPPHGFRRRFPPLMGVAIWVATRGYVCLTGQVQLAYCWLMLFELTGERSFLKGARKANAFVRKTVRTEGPPDIVGGVKGSFPVGGDYGRYQYLSWAAKFFIDSNLYEEMIMDKVRREASITTTEN